MRALFLSMLFFLLFFNSPTLYADWQRPVTNYTRHSYKAGTQNWMLEQHDNGWIYVANNKGLLEFDGKDWNLYSFYNVKMKAVKKGNDGRIYTGGIYQFGYFEPDKLGELHYVSLSDQLPQGINIGVIRNIWIGKDRVYFQADRYIFYLEHGTLVTVDCRDGISASGLLNQKLYYTSSQGLSVLEDSVSVLLSDTEVVGKCKVMQILPYKGKMLLVTNYNGLFLYDGTNVHKLTTAADAFIHKNGILCAGLYGSLLAMGTVQDGVCLLNMNTDEMEVISTVGGLQNKTVLGLLFDAVGNLWLGLDNGVDYVQLNSRLFSLYGNRALIGSGYASCVYQDRLYLGTNQGVYRTLVYDVQNQDLPMDFMEGTGGQVWSFLQHDDKLFCASDNGVFVLDGGRINRLDGLKGVRCIISLPSQPEVLIAGTYGVNKGLYLLKKEGGRWLVDTKIEGCTISCKSLLADRRERTIWIANKGEGIHRLKLSEDWHKVEQDKQYNTEKLPAYYDVCLTTMDEEIMVASRTGLWRYSETEDCLKEDRELQHLLDGEGVYTYLTFDPLHNIWYSNGNALKLIRYDAARNSYHKEVDDVFLTGSVIENFEHVSVYEGNAIIASEDGFSLFDMEKERVEKKDRVTLQIRKVYTIGLGDSLIYGRSYLPDDTMLVIPYSSNSLRIEYCANDYGLSQPVMYSYKLSSGDNEGVWSEYSENNMKEFTTLHEGKYTFSVRLFTKRGASPLTASLAFEILPPWYRTWWSYLLYTTFICLFFYYVYYRIMESHKRLVMQKEHELHYQQQEFKKESDLKDQKIDSLKEENLQAELRHKSEELIRTTLNIVRKNEMLLGIKKEVLNISHSISEENLVSLRRKTLRLLGQIETNIEHDDDLQAFQSTFDSVHHNFFRKLEEAYPELNNKDKLLCAYIKMNLLSKEIAPLLNISLRGVEISRYRLRKKLRMEEGENLAEFLQKFSKQE